MSSHRTDLHMKELWPILPADPTPMQHSRLLALPSEIRNMIYGFALTYEDGLASKGFPELGRATPKVRNGGPESLTMIHANPLKFVCRKLYYDTRGLVFHLNNTFTFRGFTTFTAFLPILSILRRYPVARINICADLSHINDLSLPECIFLRQRVVAALAHKSVYEVENFCIRNPMTNVYLYLPSFPSSLTQLVTHHRAILTVLRGESHSLERLEAMTNAIIDLDLAGVRETMIRVLAKLLESRLQLAGLKYRLPKNLRIAFLVESGRYMQWITCKHCQGLDRERVFECERCQRRITLLEEMLADGC
ncbi:hypothetical protein P153DRAFT_392217 [Dothidotthia symphoricarpi CBS 119687]|uniref:Uncharacterized protein n=1 Tax=Dothidotthia symphoricarpi CBS 119687 TaxID=1392245 RepID=A0A6A6AVD7_9PLEO|nr:uncharacterized protein P153DRAFT_392217 [Dothidotthia symphoricarpi CBS 119687]KAF2134914.1 hypothetical protein P153DRAFT_392217 [Dothidotthia symphoricarpi CBS 119687]